MTLPTPPAEVYVVTKENSGNQEQIEGVFVTAEDAMKHFDAVEWSQFREWNEFWKIEVYWLGGDGSYNYHIERYTVQGQPAAEVK